MMRMLSALLLLLCVLAHLAAAQEDAVPTQEELAKMPVKKLRQFLAARGLECKGCAEKEDFVKMAFANKDTPLKQAAEPAATPEDDSPEAKRKKDKEMEDLMASLRGSGLGDGIKMFTKDDFAGLSPEQMAEKFGGGGGMGGGGGRGRGGGSGRGNKGGGAGSRGKSGSSSRSKGGKPSSKPSKKIQEEEGDVMDL